jgi:NADH:ubiquinone oxidoreductase subunit 6 (subunit J)
LSVQAEFLALIFLIVYVGAIAILFLFVIMLLNVKELTSAPRRKLELSQLVALHAVVPLSVNLSFNLSNAIDTFLLKSNSAVFATEPTNVAALINFVNYRFLDIQMFSELLYTHYSYSFMLTALLLLTAMLGAIILATSATDADEI